VQNRILSTHPVYWPGLGNNHQSRSLRCILFLRCPHTGRLGRGQPTGVAASRDRRGRGASFTAGARPLNPALPRPLTQILAARTVGKLGRAQGLLTEKTAGGGGWLRGCRGQFFRFFGCSLWLQLNIKFGLRQMKICIDLVKCFSALFAAI
jgi:hypothetical protein